MLRRDFLKVATVLAASRIVGCKSDEPDKRNEEQGSRTPTLEQLAAFLQAQDAIVWDKDFSGSQKEIIYIADVDSTEYRRKAAPIVGALIDRFGVDSIGLEGYWGAGYDQMFEEKEAAVEQLFAELRQLIDKAPYLSAKYKGAEVRDSIATVVKEDIDLPLKRYYRQKDLTVYGLEDRDLSLKLLAALAYKSVLIRMLMGDLDEAVRMDPNSGRHLAEYFRIMKGLCADMPLPVTSVDDFNLGYDDLAQRADKFAYLYARMNCIDRTEVFARSVSAAMDNYSCRRSIVIVGGGHLQAQLPFPGLNEQVPLQQLVGSAYLCVTIK